MNLEKINDFIKQKNIAVVGVSRKPQKFGNFIFKELVKKGYTTFPVNPKMESLDNNKCYPNLKELPIKVDGVVVVVSPEEAQKVVAEACESGIKRVWLQQGSESPVSINYCTNHGVSVVAGECIMMFAPPVSFFHRIHRFFWNMLKK